MNGKMMEERTEKVRLAGLPDRQDCFAAKFKLKKLDYEGMMPTFYLAKFFFKPSK